MNAPLSDTAEKDVYTNTEEDFYPGGASRYSNTSESILKLTSPSLLARPRSRPGTDPADKQYDIVVDE